MGPGKTQSGGLRLLGMEMHCDASSREDCFMWSAAKDLPSRLSRIPLPDRLRSIPHPNMLEPIKAGRPSKRRTKKQETPCTHDFCLGSGVLMFSSPAGVFTLHDLSGVSVRWLSGPLTSISPYRCLHDDEERQSLQRDWALPARRHEDFTPLSDAWGQSLEPILRSRERQGTMCSQIAELPAPTRTDPVSSNDSCASPKNHERCHELVTQT